ncbi:MAG: prolipoprotein diacylglyceryl transferase [Dehalococcoidia bacterium]|nr:prolipoprotein diacylglyceryl transferase [Dehalococcoidia bacterium]
MNGITINIDPEILRLGGFALRWYSLTFTGGIALAVWLVLREAKRRGLNTDKMTTVALWAVVGGVVGARLFHVVDRWDYYLANPGMIPMVNHGGLAIWGGLITGGLVATIVARKERLPALKLADATVIGLIAGQMLGRVGCIINGDAYGGPTGMPWGFVYVNPGAMIPEALKGIPTHPYPVYEVMWDLGLLGLLLFLRKRELPVGMLFLFYVAGYAIGRFTLTFVRQEALWFWGLQEAQVVALVAFALAVAGVVYVLRARPVATTQRRRPVARRST